MTNPTPAIEPIHEPIVVTQHVFETKVETLRREIANGDNIVIEMLRREVAAQRGVVDERDRLYSERHQQNQISVEKALASAEKAVNAALAAAKEASFEQKEALKEYKVASNEWRSTVTDLTTQMGVIGKIEQRMTGLEEKVNELRRVDSKTEGGTEALNQSKSNQRWLIGIGVMLVIFILGQVFIMWRNAP